jgi:hypothetical protein
MLTLSTIAAAAKECLAQSGYRILGETSEKIVAHSSIAGMFEDEYGLVGLALFESWPSLVDSWADAQSVVVARMSAGLTRSEAKAWDGYLVLLTPGIVPPEGLRELTRIRYNTTRVRKLVGAGEDLKTVTDVRRVLLPLLPTTVANVAPSQNVFELFQNVMERRGITRESTRPLVEAFQRRESMVQALYERDEDAS